MWKNKVKENAKSSLSVLYQGVNGKSVKGEEVVEEVGFLEVLSGG